ncbi:hypothetical protein BASA62_000041 [Batrachochytrium salamandrivorans]|nr:hypothetical protein BASA62_000041 [Batrachochytrium salamandrivorans]
MKVIAIGLMSLLVMATNVLANPADDQDELQQEAVSEPSTSESPEATSEYDLPTTSNDKSISEQDETTLKLIKKKFLGIDKELQDGETADACEKQQQEETQKARLAMVQMVSKESSITYSTQQNAMQIPEYRKHFRDAQKRLEAKLASQDQDSDTNPQLPLDSKLPLNSNTKVKERFSLKIKGTRLVWRK